MNVLIKSFVYQKSLLNFSWIRGISTTLTAPMKQIEVVQENDTLIIRGKNVESGREALLVPQIEECAKKGTRFCPECTLGLDIKHTDVLILSQYVRADGCMLPRRITGLCRRQQKRIGTMVTMAHKAGLLSNLKPWNCSNDPERRQKHKKFNTYYLEETIKLPRPIFKDDH